MPLIIQLVFDDGSTEVHRIPAEIWRYNQKEITKVFSSPKQLTEVILDPFLETADIDTTNNYFPPKRQLSKFEMFRERQEQRRENPMQQHKTQESRDTGNKLKQQ